MQQMVVSFTSCIYMEKKQRIGNFKKTFLYMARNNNTWHYCHVYDGTQIIFGRLCLCLGY